MTEFKFYMLYSPNHPIESIHNDLGKAQEIARLRAHKGETVYVLETIWMCKPKQILDEQKITETAPQPRPPSEAL